MTKKKLEGLVKVAPPGEEERSEGGGKGRKRGEKKGEKKEGNETQLVSKILQLHQEGKKKSSVKLRKWFQNQGSGVGSVSKAVHAHNSRDGTELTSGFLGLTEKLKLNS